MSSHGPLIPLALTGCGLGLIAALQLQQLTSFMSALTGLPLAFVSLLVLALELGVHVCPGLLLGRSIWPHPDCKIVENSTLKMLMEHGQCFWEDLCGAAMGFVAYQSERPAMPGWTLEENVKMGLRQVPTKTWRARRHKPEDESVCAICLEEWCDGDRLQKLPQCSHTFHSRCMEKWAASQVAVERLPHCPLCKAPIAAIEHYY